MAVGDRNDPYRAYNFLVELDGIRDRDISIVVMGTKQDECD